MADVFISYSSSDAQAAERLARALEEGGGLSVWLAHLSLRSGESFDGAIEEALRQVSCAIVLWSQDSIKSRWVRAEAARAGEHGKLLTLRLEDGIEIPIPFNNLHAENIGDWDGSPDSEVIRRILRQIERRGSEPPAAGIRRGDQAGAKRRSRVLAYSLLVSVILAAVLLVAVLQDESSRESIVALDLEVEGLEFVLAEQLEGFWPRSIPIDSFQAVGIEGVIDAGGFHQTPSAKLSAGTGSALLESASFEAEQRLSAACRFPRFTVSVLGEPSHTDIPFSLGVIDGERDLELSRLGGVSEVRTVRDDVVDVASLRGSTVFFGVPQERERIVFRSFRVSEIAFKTRETGGDELRTALPSVLGGELRFPDGETEGVDPGTSIDVNLAGAAELTLSCGGDSMNALLEGPIATLMRKRAGEQEPVDILRGGRAEFKHGLAIVGLGASLLCGVVCGAALVLARVTGRR